RRGAVSGRQALRHRSSHPGLRCARRRRQSAHVLACHAGRLALRGDAVDAGCTRGPSRRVEDSRRPPHARVGAMMPRIIALALLVLLAVSPVAAQAPVTLAFATLDAGSAWCVYVATMAQLLGRALQA